jgi:hypothetical protein
MFTCAIPFTAKNMKELIMEIAECTNVSFLKVDFARSAGKLILAHQPK